MSSRPKRTVELLNELDKVIRAECADDTVLKQRLKQMRVRLVALFNTTDEKVFRTEKDKRTEPGALVPLPEGLARAPELWNEREDKTESVRHFLRRVYGQWIGKGLGRHHLKRLDGRLHQAIYNQETPTHLLQELGILTLKDLNSQVIEKTSGALRRPRLPRIKDMSVEERRATRISNLVRQRRRSAKTTTA